MGQDARPTVILVHGLWMTGLEMGVLRRRLTRCGFAVRRFHYRSVRQGVPEAAAALHRYLSGVDAPLVHFVAHSLGGLVVRRLLYDHPDPRVGRIVTLGTPHISSCSARRFARSRWGRRLLGASVREGLDGRVPPWTGAYSLGAIAGTAPIGLGRLFGPLPIPHDGTVAVCEARFPGVDLATVHTSHTGLLLSRQVARQTCSYLRTGAFSSG